MRSKFYSWFRRVRASFDLLLWSSVQNFVVFILGQGRWWGYLFHDPNDNPKATLHRLDALLAGLRSVDDFLDNPRLIEDYANTLESYFGSKRFSRASFHFLLSQLKEVLAQAPRLKDRLWRTESAHEFSFSSAGESLGRDVDPLLWRLYWRNYQNGLKKQLAGVSPSVSEIKTALHEYSLKVHRFINIQLKLSGHRVSKSERRFLEREFFKNVCADANIKIIVAQILLDFFSLSENRQLLHIGDGDLILYFFKDLRQNPRKIFANFPEIQLVPGLLSVARSMVPNPKSLLRDQNLFPVHYVQVGSGKKVDAGKVKESKFRTVRIRPFHALWLGIPGNDCLAGNAESTTPQRWLVAAAKGAVTSVIERDGKYQGFVRCTPVTHEDGRQYGSIEIWSPLMMRKILVPRANSAKGSLRLTPIFDVWYPQFAAGMPPHLRELVISESKMIDNFGIKEIIAQSPYYKSSIDVGPSSSFRSSDSVVEQVATVFSSRAVVGRYGPGVVFDAKILDAGHLRLLQLSSEGVL